MKFPLRCACGLLEGYVESPQRACRATCYCRDCQTFARYLGNPGLILDDLGGTDVVATSPHFVCFTHGKEHLRCMSLSEKGLLRWYAECCRTPIGNTPRNPRLSYVGLIHNCLAGTPADIDSAFGPPRVSVNTGSAKGPVPATPIGTLICILKTIRNLTGARLGGGYRKSPFFREGTSESVVAPEVLTRPQRAALSG